MFEQLVSFLSDFQVAAVTTLGTWRSSSLKCVLVQRTEGDEVDQLSIVNLDCVRGVHRVEFDGNGTPHPPTVAVVEWRAGKFNKKTC